MTAFNHPSFAVPCTSITTIKKLLFISFILLLSGCNDVETSKIAKVEQLNNSNIIAFTKQLSDDYFDQVDTLLSEFQKSHSKDDAIAFVDYRNATWTPNYTDYKNHYALVHSQNKAYLETTPIIPLFNLFETLIFTGLELKNGLLNHDEKRIRNALADAQKDKKRMNSILVSLGIAKHP